MGVALLMALISEGVRSDATRRDGPVALDVARRAERETTTEDLPPLVVAFPDDETTSSEDDLDDDSTVP
jgi:hypothetical protein